MATKADVAALQWTRNHVMFQWELDLPRGRRLATVTDEEIRRGILASGFPPSFRREMHKGTPLTRRQFMREVVDSFGVPLPDEAVPKMGPWSPDGTVKAAYSARALNATRTGKDAAGHPLPADLAFQAQPARQVDATTTATAPQRPQQAPPQQQSPSDDALMRNCLCISVARDAPVTPPWTWTATAG